MDYSGFVVMVRRAVHWKSIDVSTINNVTEKMRKKIRKAKNVEIKGKGVKMKKIRENGGK